MEVNNQDTKTSSDDVVDSARASLTLICSMLARQYLECDNNSSAMYRDASDNANMAKSVTVMTPNGEETFFVGGGITLYHINTLRRLQESLRIKNAKVAELRALLIQRETEIQELRNKLDMYRTLFQFFYPYGRFTKHRPKGDI